MIRLPGLFSQQPRFFLLITVISVEVISKVRQNLAEKRLLMRWKW